MNERIRALRKTLNLTQQEFADRLSLKRNTIATYEMGKAIPSDRTINDICNKYNVNENWLRDGVGEMFLEPKENSIVAKATMLLGEKDPLFEAFIDTYSKLTPRNRELLMQFILDFSAALNETKKE